MLHNLETYTVAENTYETAAATSFSAMTSASGAPLICFNPLNMHQQILHLLVQAILTVQLCSLFQCRNQVHASGCQALGTSLTTISHVHMQLTQLQRCLGICVERSQVVLAGSALETPDLFQQGLFCTDLKTHAPAGGA